MIKRFAALLEASSVKMNTAQCLPVQYNTFVVYNKGSKLNNGNHLQMGLIKETRIEWSWILRAAQKLLLILRAAQKLPPPPEY